MAIKILKKEYIYEEEIVFEDDKTNEVLFQCHICMTPEDITNIKNHAWKKDLDDDTIGIKELYPILFSGHDAESLKMMGEYYTDLFAYKIYGNVLGKYGIDITQNAMSGTTPYQKTMNDYMKSMNFKR